VKTNKLKVTTTPSLEGWKIEAYLGTVTSHVVAGTDMFTDMFASFSDLFGGRSKTYQRELGLLNDEATEQLREKAHLLGANWVIGMRIDHGEISGKGKQMFMVTAVGTAVRAIQIEGSKETDIKTNNLISQEDFSVLLERRRILRRLESAKLNIDSATWDFIIQNRVEELAKPILNKLERYDLNKQFPDTAQVEFINRSKQFFSNLSPEIAEPHLYSALKTKLTLTSFIIELISSSSLISIERISELLADERIEIRRAGLQLIKYDKPFYSYTDISTLEGLLPLIQENFNEQANRIVEKGKFLSSKGKEVWVCVCNEKNHIESSRCFSCNRDIYGFRMDDVTPKAATILIEDKITILREQFADVS
jgi:uncharacterized protein YbjQ (UPF0145 family)